MKNAHTEVMKRSRTCLYLSALILLALIAPVKAQTDSGPAARVRQAAVGTESDGQHDFDFAIGTWKIHLRRLQKPLTGSNTWVEFDGTLVAKTIWDGRANMEEFDVDSSTGPIHGLTIRLFNPQTEQWSIYWADRKDGTINTSAQVGGFKNRRGEFYGQDTLNGKAIYVRFVWTNTNSDSPHFEQSYSDDGGKTWEVNWVTNQTRVKGTSDKTR
jgi:hypothetical protein